MERRQARKLRGHWVQKTTPGLPNSSPIQNVVLKEKKPTKEEKIKRKCNVRRTFFRWGKKNDGVVRQRTKISFNVPCLKKISGRARGTPIKHGVKTPPQNRHST